MRYGVVGTGYWGSNHVRVADELAREGIIDEVVVCDVDEDRARTLAEGFDRPYTTSYAEMDVDAATVATPSTTHEGIATDLLESGVDLLVEKPLALTAEAAYDIVETADENDRTLGVGHIFRYHPALKDLKRRIDAGELGEIRYLHTARFSFRLPRPTTGVLYQLAVHDVDVYAYLLGETPERIYCNRDSFVRERIDETATLTMDYGDKTGVIHSSWQVPVFGKRRDLAVVGSKRAAYVDYLADTEVELYDTRVVREDGELWTRENGRTVHEVPDAEPLRQELEAFLGAAHAGKTPPASGRVGARTISLLERAIDADNRNQVVDVDRRRPRRQSVRQD